MKIFVSYFYQVRFLKPTEVPLSTAVWDPKWFHDFKGQDYVFEDKRGVINGIRAGMFAPDETCSNLCRGRDSCQATGPDTCPFLKMYRRQLDKMDFPNLIEKLEQLSLLFKEQLKLPSAPDFVLLVHEAPDNPCSERVVLQSWFRDNGMELREWSKD